MSHSHHGQSYLDRYSAGTSLIHRLDPRAKLLSILTVVLFIVFTPPEAFLEFLLYGLLLALLIWASRIPVLFILRRSLVVIPFVLLIAAFIPFLKPGTVAGAYSFGTLKLTVTYEGVMVFWNVLVKSYLCTLALVLLTASTELIRLLKALERLKCPRLIILILAFMYRYVFGVQDELIKMMHAKEARGSHGPRWLQLRAAANMIGVLFVRAYERGESVYLSMRARGFDGGVRMLDDLRFSGWDAAFLCLFGAALLGVRLLGGYMWR